MLRLFRRPAVNRPLSKRQKVRRDWETGNREVQFNIWGRKMVPRNDITPAEAVQLSILCSIGGGFYGVTKEQYERFIEKHGLGRHFEYDAATDFDDEL